MARLIYQDTEVELAAEDTVLEALLRCGVDIPYSCTSGVCQSCIVRSDGSAPPTCSQIGLKDTLATQGYFLACQCRASDIQGRELRVSLGSSDELFVEATLTERSNLSANVVQLILKLMHPFSFQPGQFVHLRKADGLVRSYSIANGPAEQHIELHVGKVSKGKMSTYLFDELQCGDTISVRGPSGNCFYVPGRPEQSLLLVGTGTGLAPLLGIVRAALASNHTGNIHLFHGSVGTAGIYLNDELRVLATQHTNVHYYACVDDASPQELKVKSLKLGRASDLALTQHSDLTGWRVFLCGHPKMVKTTKKLSYLAGASMSDIFSDPFEISAAPTK